MKKIIALCALVIAISTTFDVFAFGIGGTGPGIMGGDNPTIQGGNPPSP